MSGQTPQWGLAGVGRHANISAELDEPIGREGPWSLQLAGPRWSFRLDVSGPETVRSLLAFVKEHGSKPGYEHFQISKREGAEIEIAKTSDLGVRFELRVCAGDFTVTGTVQDDDVNSFQKALEGIVQDLDI